MKWMLFAAVAMAISVEPAHAQSAKPTPAEAKAFVDKAEAELAAFSEYAARIAWVRATYIIDDTQWLDARAQAEQKTMATAFAKQAAKYDGVQVDPVTGRKLMLLKLFLVLPAP